MLSLIHISVMSDHSVRLFAVMSFALRNAWIMKDFVTLCIIISAVSVS